ncbi:MAG TPA: methyltransferase, partial [Candidatus Nanopelagicales bacterium]|nr:methyltransferase [Candidatus Nanopelagicales bacterium]
PDLAPHIRLVRTCLARYGDLLAGRLAATDVLVPGGSMDLVEGIYKGNPIADYYNRLLASRVAALAGGLLDASSDRIVRVLEVGAGTGGTSAFVLPALTPLGARVEYTYSDVSKAFLDHGRARFSARFPFARFHVLDLERDPRAQGWDLRRHDVVIGANVVHATRRIERTLDRIKALMTTGGWLVLNEATAASDFLTITFGLLEGWWLTEDPDRRLPHAPLLDAQQWSILLRERGFEQVQAVAHPGADAGAIGQHLLFGRSDGLLRVAAPEPRMAAEPAIESDTPRAPQPRIEASSAAPEPASARAAFSSAALRRHVQQAVLHSLLVAMGLEPGAVDLGLPFSDYGVDSITGVALINALGERLGLVLRTSLLFDCAGVLELTDWLVEHHGPQLGQALAAPEPVEAGAQEAQRSSPDLPRTATADTDPLLDTLNRLARGEIDVAQVEDLLG